MNYIYPAIFYPEANGKYSVIFPDLNDLATYGDNLADAFAMAQEACGQYLFTSLRDGDVLPAPTAINAVKSDDPTALINLICVNLDNYARAYDDRAVKKTLTIPAWLNTACDNCGINYSKVLRMLSLPSCNKCKCDRITKSPRIHCRTFSSDFLRCYIFR